MDGQIDESLRERIVEALKDAACQILDLTGDPEKVRRYDELIEEIGDG